MKPLDGIKIVEYGVFHAGPGGTAILGDLGADIIKIEAPAGDPIRFWTDLGRINLAAPNGSRVVAQMHIEPTARPENIEQVLEEFDRIDPGA